MTSDILKRAAEVALLPCPFCGRAAHLRDDASHSTAAFIGCETEGCFGYMLWAETATDAAREWNQRPDMAAAIAERDVENARLTARAEAAEAREAALLAANDVNRKLMLERNAEVDRWKKMADRLAVALKETSDAHMSWVHDSRDGCWTIEDFDSESAVATEALAAHAAMKEARK